MAAAIYKMQWILLVVFMMKGASSECNVNKCDPNACSGSSCNNCVDGYYLSGYTYCGSCPTHCLKCDSYSSCQECEAGYYGDTCDSSCRGQCTECSAYSSCTDCVVGRYDSYCNTNCPKGCIDILCEKDSGQCLLGCIHGYYNSGGNCVKCPETCERCSDEANCDGCVDGYFGTDCGEKCFEGCLNQACDQELGQCTEGCSVGYYQDGSDCTKCQEKCMTCVDTNTCTECKTGYWGAWCQNNCPTTCNKCAQDGSCITDRNCNVNHCDEDFCFDGSCNKCVVGYYISGYTYCSGCPTNCVSCTDYFHCEHCIVGKYGDECESSCRSQCITCETYNKCNECVVGRYGTYCNINCPKGCIDILCEKDTGKCSLGCIHGYYKGGEDCIQCPETCDRCSDPTNCTGCVDGYHGSYCHLLCPDGCLNQACHQESGYCTEGCSDGFYQDGTDCTKCPEKCMTCDDANTCTECKTGYWGTRCEANCPSTCNKCTQDGFCITDRNCNVNHCDEDFCYDGSCNKCVEGYYISGYTYCSGCPSKCVNCTDYFHCEQCIVGKYGEQCESSCRSQCITCETYDKCNECVVGRYGTYCNINCPKGCIDILCEKDTGKCSLGCIHGYYKSEDDCVQCSENCLRCSSETDCSLCKDGYYGPDCQSTCPLGCLNQQCDKDTYACTGGCSAGYFQDGTECTTCPDQCMSCDAEDICTECKTGYWGTKCEHACSASCHKCGKDDGECIADDPADCSVNNCDTAYCSGSGCIKCKDGYYLSGSTCSKCRSDCTTCSSYYVCTDCPPMKHGTICDESCSSVCTDCISSTQCVGCIPGRHGSVCQELCSLGCIDILCDQKDGKCTLGCKPGYHSSETGCDECPEQCVTCDSSINCTSCSQGMYGPFCEDDCPMGCENQICDISTGDCTDGCAEGYLFQQGHCVDAETVCQVNHCVTDNCFGNICTACEDGYYVDGNTCHKCPDECTKCSSFSHCEDCIVGKQGPACEFDCSSTCKHGLCSKYGFCTEGCKDGYTMTGGTCQSCPNNCELCTSKEECITCDTGFWGEVCQYACVGCNTVGCGQITDCIKGCLDGFYANITGQGHYTCLPCHEKCQTCDSGDACNTCSMNYWGDDCQNNCPTNCKAGTCDEINGLCTEGCKNGFYGDTCSDRCLSKCTTCESGAECTTCAEGKYGPACELECSETCFRNTCYRNNGTCSHGCEAGYYGDTCLDDTGTIWCHTTESPTTETQTPEQSTTHPNTTDQQSTTQQAQQSTNQSAPQSTTQPVQQSTTQPAQQSTTQESQQSSTQKSQQTSSVQTQQSTTQPTQQSTAQATQQPTTPAGKAASRIYGSHIITITFALAGIGLLF